MRDKILIFIVGILLGILAGGGFFILKLDEYLKELTLYKDFSRQIQQQIAALSKEDKIKELHRDTSSAVFGDSVETVADSPGPPKSRNNVLLMDDLKPVSRDSVLDNDSLPLVISDNIIVKKDELLSIRPIELINLDADTDEGQPNAKDSLLQKISGVRSDKTVSKVFTVELWQSPVNYRGYKMSRNKVILFGVYPVEGIKLYKWDERIYLGHHQNLYELDFTYEYKQFEKVNDPLILMKIMK